MGAPKTLIAIPCMDMVHTDFMLSLLNMQRTGTCFCQVVKSSLIYSARNKLAAQAIDGDYDRVLWLDSDVVFEPSLMSDLSAHLDGGLSYVSGMYFKRQLPTEPVCYKEVVQIRNKDGLETRAIPYNDYPQNQLFEVDSTGFGAVMMTTDLLKKVQDKYGLPFSPILGLGEDMSFCWRVKQLGEALYCDSRIKLWHIGLAAYGEETYFAQHGQD